MPRIGRWVLNALTLRLRSGLAALSLLLCVGMCVLWVRSYWVSDDFLVQANARPLNIHRPWRLTTGRGVFVVSWDGRAQLVWYENVPPSWGWLRHRTQSPWNLARISMARDVLIYRVSATESLYTVFPWELDVPFRTLFVLLALPSLVWWLCRKWRRWREPLQGHCDACSYNLTGNISGVCPECGRKIAEANGTPEKVSIE